MTDSAAELPLIGSGDTSDQVDVNQGNSIWPIRDDGRWMMDDG